MRSLFIPMVALVTAGCAGAIDAPSLAPRASERQPIDAPGDAIERPTDADPALTARLTPIVATVEQGDSAFQKERNAAETAVARAAGASAGSGRWLIAQQALSVLETTLGVARDAAAAIDALRAEPANAAPGNRAAIDAAAAQVDAITDVQGAALAALAARLG